MTPELKAEIIRLIDARILAAAPFICKGLTEKLMPAISKEMERASDQVVKAMKDIADNDPSESWKRGQDDSDE
jgi:hypothetical protein